MKLQMPKKITQTSLFIVMLALGIFFIGLGKWFDSLYFILCIAIPVLLMLAYAGFNVRSNFLDSTRTQVADNCYFLGFLYFLASLAITLSQFSTGIGPDAKIDVAPIIRGFGVALVTTITGLFLRILMLQNIAGLTSAREKAEETLLTAVNLFHDQIQLTLDLLAKARDEVLSSTQLTTEKANEALRAVTEASRQTLEATTEGYVKTLGEAAQRTSNELTGVVTDLRRKVTTLDIPADVVTRQIDPALSELRTLVGSLGSEVSVISTGVAENAAQTRKLAPQLTKVLTNLVAQSELMEQTLKRISDQGAPLGSIGTHLAQAAEGAQRLAEELERRLAAIKQTPNAAQEATQAVAQLSDVVSGMAKSLQSIVVSMESGIAKVDAGLRHVETQTQQIVTASHAATTAIANDVHRLGQSVDRIQQSVQRTEVQS